MWGKSRVHVVLDDFPSTDSPEHNTWKYCGSEDTLQSCHFLIISWKSVVAPSGLQSVHRNGQSFPVIILHQACIAETHSVQYGVAPDPPWFWCHICTRKPLAAAFVCFPKAACAAALVHVSKEKPPNRESDKKSFGAVIQESSFLLPLRMSAVALR